MASKALGRYAEKDINLSRAIEACMKRKGITGPKLAEKIGIVFSTHYKRLKKPEGMKLEELRGYINTLDIPEEDILDALYLHREKK